MVSSLDAQRILGVNELFLHDAVLVGLTALDAAVSPVLQESKGGLTAADGLLVTIRG